MRKVHIVYDVTGLSIDEKEDIIKYLEYRYGAEYDYGESNGSIFDAEYISCQTFSGEYYGEPVNVVITASCIRTVREFWGYRGKIEQWCKNCNIGRM